MNCRQPCGDFRYSDPAEEAPDNMGKKRVIPLSDGRIPPYIQSGGGEGCQNQANHHACLLPELQGHQAEISFEVAQKELYDPYSNGFSNLWFDYQEGAKKGRGGKVLSIVAYIYTKDNPKQGNGLLLAER